MPAFCGQDQCLIDANGRLKLPPQVIDDFFNSGGGRIVFFCLPEGALALYPEAVYQEMRAREPGAVKQAATSLLERRTMRYFGAMSQSCEITRQGRITVPGAFRTMTGLNPGTQAWVIGSEIGVEIWTDERWQKELLALCQHLNDKGQVEMNADLQ